MLSGNKAMEQFITNLFHYLTIPYIFEGGIRPVNLNTDETDQHGYFP